MIERRRRDNEKVGRQGLLHTGQAEPAKSADSWEPFIDFLFLHLYSSPVE